MNGQLRAAAIISRVFEPALTLSMAFIVYAAHAGIAAGRIALWAAVIIFPPMTLRIWAHQAKGLDWDIHERKKRVVPLLILLFLLAFDLVLFWLFEPRLLGALALFFLWTTGFFIITKYWTKISGHTSANALASGMVVRIFGWRFWPVLLIVPLVAWARVIRKDHTVGHVVLGAAYSWGLLACGV